MRFIRQHLSRFFFTALTILATTSLVPNLLPSALAMDPSDEQPVLVTLIAEHESLSALNRDAQLSTTLALHFRIAPGWHIYWKNSGDSAIPTNVRWTLSNGWQVGELQWPTPLRFIERGELTTFGYQKETILLAEVQAIAPETYDAGTLDATARVHWLVCKDVCIPGSADLSLSIPLTSSDSSLSPSAKHIAETKALLPRHSIPDVSIKTKLRSTSIAPGAEGELLFFIEGLPKTVDAGTIQLFPGPSDHSTLGAAELALSEDSHVIRTPLTLLAGATLGELTLQGVLAFENQGTLQSLTWEATLPVEKSPHPVSDSSAKAFSDLQFTPLTYRLHRWDTGAVVEQTQLQTIPVSNASPGIFLSLLFAFIGGMILNLMPCVLPIIGIKVMGFLEHRKGEATKSALSFCGGILFSFVILACGVIALRSLGVQLGWGFQFQHPEFVLSLTLIVFVLSLGFFDLYVLNVPGVRHYCSTVDSLKPSHKKHFFDGILATILSTPCTAPFLGTALVVAFTQGPWITLAIHIAIGLGLAFPYFLFATNPKCIALLPKPGDWMHRMRQLMGFFLLATVLWLLFVLLQLTGEGVIWTLVLMLLVVFSLWVLDASAKLSRRGRLTVQLVTICLFLVATLSLVPQILSSTPKGQSEIDSSGPIAWQSYSPEAVQAALASQRPVFIDFTADWCITCKANEFLIIDTTEVSQAIKENNVAAFIADWTDGDEVITRALSSYGARGVPLYVVLSPASPQSPLVLSTIPSKSSLIDAFRQAASMGTSQR